MTRRTLLLLPLLWLALFAAYQPALHGGVLWDDADHLTKAELRSADGLRRIWTEPGATQQYYPLTHTAFWIQNRLWGHETTGYHVVNITLHAVSAFLVILVLRRLEIPGAVLAGFVFALHPVQVESVAWMTELKNTLSGVFYLGAALAYLSFDAHRRPSMYVLATTLFVLALFSKTVTATLPAALLVVFWWRRGRLTWRRDVRPLVPWVLAGAGAGVVTVWAERTLIGAAGQADLSAVERVLVAGRAFWFYLDKAIRPTNLIFIYPRWNVSAGVWWQYLFPLAALGLVALFWHLRHRTRAPLAATLFFAGTLFPALGFFNVYPFRYSFVADHFQYLATIGVIALASAGLSLVLSRRMLMGRPLLPGASIAIGAVLGVLTWQQSHQYVNAETLYLTTIARNPSCWMAYNNLGEAALRAGNGQLDRAVDYLQASVRLNPDNPEARNNLGFAWQRQGRFELALAEHEAAIRLQPGYFEATLNLAVDLQGLGRVAEALPSYAAAIQLNPHHARARYSFGSALQQVGRLDEAITQYREALRLDPSLHEAHHNLGMAYETLDRFDDAMAEYRRATEVNPRSAESQDGLGYALLQLGRREEAIARFEEAIRIRPDYAPAHRNLGDALQQSGRLTDAVAAYRRALQYESGRASSRTHNNLGAALADLGQIAEAIVHFREAVRLDPSFADARDNLARAIRLGGRGDPDRP